MRIIFFGTSDLAAFVLEKITSTKHRIVGVVTAADRKKGRGKKISFSPVKILAQKKGLSLFQPENLGDTAFIQCLKESKPELFIVCAYGKLLTKEILPIPLNYAINLHASLLPKYRGAAPINWTIINGERETGVTIFKMNEGMDKGEIILQKKLDIAFQDTAISLAEKLAPIAAHAVLEAIDLIAADKATFTRQDESQASLAPKLKKEDGLINWETSAVAIHNCIRGLQPWPGAFTHLQNKLLKVWESKVIEGELDARPGEIVRADKEGILVQTANGQLLITVLQLEGKRRMNAQEFMLGHKIEVGIKLGQFEQTENRRQKTEDRKQKTDIS